MERQLGCKMKPSQKEEVCRIVRKALELGRTIRGELVGIITFGNGTTERFTMLLALANELKEDLVRIQENEQYFMACCRVVDINNAIEGTDNLIDVLRFVLARGDECNNLSFILSSALSNLCGFTLCTINVLFTDCSIEATSSPMSSKRPMSCYNKGKEDHFLCGLVEDTACVGRDTRKIMEEVFGAANATGPIKDQTQLIQLLIKGYRSILNNIQLIITQVNSNYTKCSKDVIKGRLINIWKDASFLENALRAVDDFTDPCQHLSLLGIFSSRSIVIEVMLNEIVNLVGCHDCKGKESYSYGRCKGQC